MLTIQPNTNLGLIAEMMGKGASEFEARMMRTIVVALEIDTAQLTEEEWLRMLSAAAAASMTATIYA